MVRNLFLVRHADAVPQAKDQRDFQRVLSEYGIKQSTLLGDHIRSKEIAIQTIFSSPAQRTIETSQKILEKLERPPKLVISEEFYEATKNTMVAAINRLEDMFENVVVVAHNPAVSMLVDYLVDNGPAVMSTSACVWVQFNLESWNMITAKSGTLMDYYYPGQY